MAELWGEERERKRKFDERPWRMNNCKTQMKEKRHSELSWDHLTGTHAQQAWCSM